MNKINNLHDKVFKAAMTDIAVAKSFFENYLPAPITKNTDWTTLQLSSHSFVDKDLEEKFSDLLYNVQVYGKESHFYLLVEHQSEPDISMAFRLLEYQVKIWRQHLKQSNRKNTEHLNLPVIYPMIYYTGKRKPYPHSNDLFDCFIDSKSAKHYLFKPFQLIDLTQIPDDELKKNELISGLMLIQKHLHKRNTNLLINLMFEKGVWVPILKHDGEYLYVLLKYISEMGEIESPDEFFDKLAQLVPEEEEKIMTIAEYYRKEGRKEAKVETLHQVAEQMLKLNQPLDLIRQVTHLSEAKLKEIQKTLH